MPITALRRALVMAGIVGSYDEVVPRGCVQRSERDGVARSWRLRGAGGHREGAVGGDGGGGGGGGGVDGGGSDVRLYTKGADSVLLELLAAGALEDDARDEFEDLLCALLIIILRYS